MPILRYKNKISHFVHIPKCGGSSIEDYLSRVNIKIGFYDNEFTYNPSSIKWNITSPQHIDGYSLSRLFPHDFFDFAFVIVRNPIARFLSAYKFQMLVEKKFSFNTDINDFIKNDLKDILNEKTMFDNHFTKQIDFLHPNLSYDIFKLENGTDRIKKYIDNKFRIEFTTKKIRHKNKENLKSKYLTFKKKNNFTISLDSKKILKEIYYDDFKKFLYDIE